MSAETTNSRGDPENFKYYNYQGEIIKVYLELLKA